MIISVKERVKLFIKSINMSIIDFERSINVANGYVNSISKGIGADKTTAIIEKYPNLNLEWLLTGNGSMLRTENSDHLCIEVSQNCTSGTPIYDIDVTCGNEIRDFRDEDIIGYINIPSIRKDSKIVFATGDSMFPKITDGDRIVIREIESWDYFNYGQMYLILTPEYRMLKYIRKHPKSKDMIVLKSENSNYDDIELKMSEIVKLFIVENILSIKSL